MELALAVLLVSSEEELEEAEDILGSDGRRVDLAGVRVGVTDVDRLVEEDHVRCAIKKR